MAAKKYVWIVVPKYGKKYVVGRFSAEETAKKYVQTLNAPFNYLIKKQAVESDSEMKSNPVKKKFSPAQIAAQKLFAERARAGTLNQRKKRKPNPGLYENIDAKRKRIAAGSGEKMRKPGQAGRPTAEAFEQSAMTAKRNPIMGPVQTKRVIQALEETQAALSRATRYSPENQDKDLIDFYKKHIAKLTKAVETGFFISDDRFSNRRANPDKSKPRAYVMRASQATGRPPVKGTKAGNRLITRRKMALSAPAGYFPNPYTMGKSKKKANFPYCVETKATENWNTKACFKTLAPAKEYAVALSKQYPKLAIRVMQYAGGAM